MNNLNNLYTVREVSDLFHKTPNLIYKEIKKQKLRPIGRPIRIHKVAVQDYLVRQHPEIEHFFERS
jgi:hypothetical protein